MNKPSGTARQYQWTPVRRRALAAVAAIDNPENAGRRDDKTAHGPDTNPLRWRSVDDDDASLLSKVSRSTRGCDIIAIAPRRSAALWETTLPYYQ